jgi:hypothetical protein
MPDLDLPALREIAEKATPGRWLWSHTGDRSLNWAIYGEQVPSVRVCADANFPDANFIATFNPVTVLALLDEIDRLKQELGNSRWETDHQEKLNATLRSRIEELEKEKL